MVLSFSGLAKRKRRLLLSLSTPAPPLTDFLPSLTFHALPRRSRLLSPAAIRFRSPENAERGVQYSLSFLSLAQIASESWAPELRLQFRSRTPLSHLPKTRWLSHEFGLRPLSVCLAAKAVVPDLSALFLLFSCPWTQDVEWRAQLWIRSWVGSVWG